MLAAMLLLGGSSAFQLVDSGAAVFRFSKITGMLESFQLPDYSMVTMEEDRTMVTIDGTDLSTTTGLTLLSVSYDAEAQTVASEWQSAPDEDDAPAFHVFVTYSLLASGGLRKDVGVESSLGSDFLVTRVEPVSEMSVAATLTETHTALEPYFGNFQTAACARFEEDRAGEPLPQLSLCVAVATPYATYVVGAAGADSASTHLAAGFDAGFTQQSNTSLGLRFHAEPALILPCIRGAAFFGTVTRTASALGLLDGSGLNVAEHRAIAAAADDLSLDGGWRGRAQTGALRVHVAWDESDFQIDIGDPTAPCNVSEVHRILQRCSDWRIAHAEVDAFNSKEATREGATDVWGWESGLWLSMGERIRGGDFDPVEDSFPEEVQSLLDVAADLNVSLNAYVYPVLPFGVAEGEIALPEAEVWLRRYGDCVVSSNANGYCASLASVDFQDWLAAKCCGMMDKGVGGFNWDYTFWTDENATEYAQVRGWLRILTLLRRCAPDLVMDHRQQAHGMGPWYQLAGSYTEPLASDENPDTFGLILPSLHNDHIFADYQRLTSYVYSVGQQMPVSRLPGWIGHQQERNNAAGEDVVDGPLNLREFDFLGFEYSVMSSIGTAPLNSVFAHIPARDEDEFLHLPQSVTQFVRRWLDWADSNIAILSRLIPILGPPAFGSIDGTAATNDTFGFVFLFNPNWIPLDATVALDEHVGIGNASQGSMFDIEELYPQELAVPPVAHGGNMVVTVPPQSALLLQLQKQQNDDRAGEPRLYHAPGQVTLTPSNVLTLSGLVGPTGQSADNVHVVLDAPPATVMLEGKNVTDRVEIDVLPDGGARVSLPAGAHFDGQAPSACVAPAGFGTSNWLNCTVTVPQSSFDQLAARDVIYPVEWNRTEGRSLYSARWSVNPVS